MSTSKSAVVCSIAVLLSGCVSYPQSPESVYVRDPALKEYSAEAPGRDYAVKQWEYAALSENAYQNVRALAQADAEKFADLTPAIAAMTESGFNAACEHKSLALPVPGWQIWKGFPSEELQRRMVRMGLYAEVRVKQGPEPTIAVIFEGTNFSERPDWFLANLRWLTRFLPGEDQYNVTGQALADEFVAELYKKYRVSGTTITDAENRQYKLITTGHSLGGGLAQHFAYALKQQQMPPSGPRVAEVFAFDTSPVTGWSTIEPLSLRNYNADGLVIHRVFEHGEVLAYLRLVTSRFVGSEKNPAIWEYRYNFLEGRNVIANHSMRDLACGLAKLAKPWAKNHTNAP